MFEVVVIMAVVLAIIVAAILIVAATKPDVVRVQRAATIQAPPENVFRLIDDFRLWANWSPWENRDPAMKRTYDGSPSGRGAVYAWDGNKNVGSGRMEILDAARPSKIVIKLDFFKPFEAHNTAEFTMLPHGAATEVVWTMYGPASLMSKVLQVFMNMDRMIGRDFEAGLVNLRQLAEK